MTTPNGMLDDVIPEVLAWAKALAKAEGAATLDLRHLLLGALKTDRGRAVLSDLLDSELPTTPEKLDPDLRKRLTKAAVPVTDQQLDLSPGLKKLTEDVWLRFGGLGAKPVLEQVLGALRTDTEWQRLLFNPAAAAPRAAADTGEVLRALAEEVQALRRQLVSNVVGQDRAIEAVCQAWFNAAVQERSKMERVASGPRMILTFVGPPGVGKTFLAELLAAHIATGDNRAPLLRLDMTAYATHQAHEQLVGFNPAYRGAGKGVLTGFVTDHPLGVILVDEVEKAHQNTQNLFLQILDAGRLYENNTGEHVDFSRATVIFTTNLGRELYDAPNRVGVLSDTLLLSQTVLEALGKEAAGSNQNGDSSGLSPELLSRLAKGQTVLFQRLDGLALERIAELTINKVCESFRSATGLRLQIAEPVILTLLVLRFGAGGDGRRLTTGLQNFLFSTLREILQDTAVITALTARPQRTLQLVLEAGTTIPPPIQDELSRQLQVVVIDDDAWARDPGEGLAMRHARNKADADEFLRRRPADVVLLDLHIGASREQSEMDHGLALLRWLRTRYADTPVYLFSESADSRGLTRETLDRVSRQGGARGVLNKGYYADASPDPVARESFNRELREAASAIRRQTLVRDYQRRLKLVDFDVEARTDADNGPVQLAIRRIREVTVVSVADRNQRGWVDLPTVRFSDLAGVRQAKLRLAEVVSWLKKADELERFGLEVPRGILLTGPPGTGKTTLARAVAGEAEVPFFAISGSEVFSKYVGESESIVREIFDRARRYAPAIIFIDELDSLGARRSASGENDYRVSVLNELLARMDGFSKGDRPVFVLAATNRPDILDPALLRPGRFDLQIAVPEPDAAARRELFDLYLKGKPCADGLDLEGLVGRTGGMSGADIRQVCKEAGFQALRRDANLIEQRDLQEAVTNTRLGLAAETALLDADARWSTAVHEAGHAVLQHILFPETPVAQITILPRGRALGFTEQMSTSDYEELTADRLARRVSVLLGGRVAEEQLLDPGRISAGCENDLQRASALAVSYVLRWGMDEKAGLLNAAGVRQGMGDDSKGHAPSTYLSAGVDRAERWLNEQKHRTTGLLQEQRDTLSALAKLLETQETLYQEDLERFFGARNT